MKFTALVELSKRNREVLSKQPPATYEQIKAQAQKVASRGKDKKQGENPNKKS